MYVYGVLTMPKKEFKVKEEVPEDAGVPTVMDKLNDLGVTKDQLYSEGNPDVDEEADKPKQARIIAIINSTRKSKLMIAECKQRGLELATVITEEKFHENPLKLIPKIIDQEKAQGNEYQVLYLPISNTDYNKNSNEWVQLRGLLVNQKNLSVNYYFDGHDDKEISNRVFAAGIE